MDNYIEYYFTNNDIPDSKRFDITEEESLKCQKKYNILSRKLEIENIFDVFIEEYKQFKAFLSEAQLSQEFDSYSVTNAHIEDQRIRTKLNVSYLGILNTGKLLLDRLYHSKTPSIINEIDTESSLLEEFLKERERVFKSNQYYVLGCNLRNLCQHKLLPINRLTLHYPQKAKLENDAIARFTLSFKVSTMKTEDNRFLFKKIESKFKENIKETDQIDLNRLIDGYFEGVFDLIRKFRELVKCLVLNSESYFEELANKAIFGKESFTAPALFIAGECKFYLDFDWFRVARYLEEKNNLYFKSAYLIRTQYIEKPKT